MSSSPNSSFNNDLGPTDNRTTSPNSSSSTINYNNTSDEDASKPELVDLTDDTSIGNQQLQLSVSDNDSHVIVHTINNNNNQSMGHRKAALDATRRSVSRRPDAPDCVDTDSDQDVITLDNSLVMPTTSRPQHNRKRRRVTKTIQQYYRPRNQAGEVVLLSDTDSSPDIHVAPKPPTPSRDNNRLPNSTCSNHNKTRHNQTVSSSPKNSPKKLPRPERPDTPPNVLKCPICIETYANIKERGCKVVVTKCGHMFCDFCLKRSLTSNGRKCPKCRKNLPKGNTAMIEVFDVC